MNPLVRLELATWRTKMGLSQEALSHQIGITQKQISAIERGAVTRLELATLWKLCMFFKCSPNDLLTLQEADEGGNIKDARRLIAEAKAKAKATPVQDRAALWNRFENVRQAIAKHAPESES